jgi:hypothetical protein
MATLAANGLDGEASQRAIIRTFTTPEAKPLVDVLINPPSGIMSTVFRRRIDLLPIMQQFVRDNNLTPRDNLRIVSYDLGKQSAKVYQGTNYDLAKALAASSSIPGITRPVLDRQGTIFGAIASGARDGYARSGLLEATKGAMKGVLAGRLVDGAMYHWHTADFSEGQALVFKIGNFPKPAPEGGWSLPDRVWQGFQNRYLSKMLERWSKDPEDPHMVVQVAKPGPVTAPDGQFGLKEVQALVDYGYQQTKPFLSRQVLAGRLPILEPTPNIIDVAPSKLTPFQALTGWLRRFGRGDPAA